MDYRLLNSYVALFLVFSLILLVVFKGERSLGKRIYTVHVVSLWLWILGLTMFYQTQDHQVATFWTKFLYVSASFIPATFIHFSFVFTVDSKGLALFKKVLLYLPNVVLFYLFFFTPHIIKGVAIENGEKAFIYGWGHFLWDLQFSATFLIGLSRFYKIYKSSVGIQKLRAKYVLLGTLSPLILATTTNVIMPWFNRFDLLWFGPFAALGWVSASTYTIIRYRVLNTSIVLKRGLILFFAFLVASIPFVLLLYLVQSITSNTIIQALVVLFFAFISAIIFLRLRIRSDVTFNQLLSKEKYQYRNTVRELSEELVSKLAFQELLNEAVNILSQSLVVKKVEIYIYSEGELELKASTETELRVKKIPYKPSAPLFPDRSILFKEELKTVPNHQNEKLFEELEAEVLIPVIYKNNFLALCVLGRSEVDYIYSQEDVIVFKTFSNQIAIALQNAQSYQMVQDLNLNLEQKVEERTRELKETQAQLLHSAKLASIGELAAGVAHELNNALDIAVLGYIRLKKKIEEASSHPEMSWFLKDTERGVGLLNSGINRAHGVVKNLLIFSKKNAEGFHYQDIHEGIESSLQILNNELKDRVCIHKDFCNQTEVYCDLNQLNQVFLNIFKNASDAINGNGNIWIKTYKEDGQFIVSIKDDGVGIEKKILDRIFDPFFTTKDVGKGTGLGLSISYNIVKSHQGSIDIKSEFGQGSEFIIKLPVTGFEGGKNESANREAI